MFYVCCKLGSRTKNSCILSRTTLIIILIIRPPELETLAQAKTLIHQACEVKREDAVTLNSDKTWKDQWEKTVIKRNCKSTNNCCLKCINVYGMLAKVCLICGKLPSTQACATLKSSSLACTHHRKTPTTSRGCCWIKGGDSFSLIFPFVFLSFSLSDFPGI